MQCNGFAATQVRNSTSPPQARNQQEDKLSYYRIITASISSTPSIFFLQFNILSKNRSSIHYKLELNYDSFV